MSRTHAIVLYCLKPPDTLYYLLTSSKLQMHIRNLFEYAYDAYPLLH